ncbi:MAG TPA: exosortase/archaeosortase family protein [Candidatus Didemnitutus sp.]
MVVFQWFGNSARGYIDTRSIFRWWGYQWIDPASECQHGWLILGASLWLVWRHRPVSPMRWRSEVPLAAAVMIGGLSIHLLGYALQQTRLSIVALLVFAGGWILLAGGRAWGRAVVFPLGFLLFAIPLNVLDTLGFYLRLGIIAVSSHLAHGVGIAVIRNGTQLLSPDGRYSYDVAAACSGVNSLLALAALSTLAGYLSFRTWPRRTVIALSCIPFAFLGNVLRIFLIVVAAAWRGQHAGQVVHDWFGFLIFLVVLALVLAAVALVHRLWPEGPEGPAGTKAAPERAPTERGSRAASTAIAVGVVAALVIWGAARLDTWQAAPVSGIILAPNETDPAELPESVGAGWFGHPTPVTAVERQVLPPDTGFSRKSYVSALDPAEWVLLSVVLSGRDRTSIHRPELCLVGQGWTIMGRSERHFSWPGGNGASIRATVLHVERTVLATSGHSRRVPAVFVYWFVGAGRQVATSWERVLDSATDLLLHQRRHRWAYVFALTPLDGDETDAFDRLQLIFNRTLPAFEEKPRN